MRFNPISWVALGASLVLLPSVQAAPIRVTVVTHQEWISSPAGGGPDSMVFRFGHAMGVPGAPGLKKPGCHMRPASGGRPSVADTIRHALGLPPVEHEHHHGHAPGPPPPMLLKPILIAHAHQESMLAGTHVPHDVKISGEPFLRRVHEALLTLGKWEARSVAFVLGCGIGVLLRMVWVFFVLIFRGLREESSNTAVEEYTLVLAHVDETLPKYTDQGKDIAPAYVDEKTEPQTGAWARDLTGDRDE